MLDMNRLLMKFCVGTTENKPRRVCCLTKDRELLKGLFLSLSFNRSLASSISRERATLPRALVKQEAEKKKGARRWGRAKRRVLHRSNHTLAASSPAWGNIYCHSHIYSTCFLIFYDEGPKTSLKEDARTEKVVSRKSHLVAGTLNECTDGEAPMGKPAFATKSSCGLQPNPPTSKRRIGLNTNIISIFRPETPSVWGKWDSIRNAFA